MRRSRGQRARPPPPEAGYRERSRSEARTVRRGDQQPSAGVGRALDHERGERAVLRERRIVQPRRHVVGIFVTASVALACAVFAIAAGHPLGWPSAVMFGLVAFVCPVMMWRPATISLTNDQPSIRAGLRSESYAWRDITDIRIWEIRHVGRRSLGMVVVDLRRPSSRVTMAGRMPGAGQAALPQVGVEAEELPAIATRYWRNARQTPCLEQPPSQQRSTSRPSQGTEGG